MNFTSLDNLERFLNKLSFATKESGVLNSIINSYLNDFKDDLVRIVQELPQSGEDGILYLVPQGNDRFIEYYYNNEWIQLGSSVFDYTVDSTLSNNSTNTIQNSTIKNALDSKLNANQVVNALNDSSNETPQSGVLYNSLEEKVTSSDFLNISNNNIDALFLADSEAFFDFEIKIPYDSKMTGNLVGSYADAGDDTVYNHYRSGWNIMERFKFAGLTPKSFSNLSNLGATIIFEDAQGNEYEAEISTGTTSRTSGKDLYWPIAAFDGYSNTKNSFGNFWCFVTAEGVEQNDLILKIHFTDAFKIDEKFNFSFYTSNYYDTNRQRAGSPRLEYVQVRGSTDLENYTDIVNLQNVWVSDYFKYNQHSSEYLSDRENSKWVFNLF